LNGNGMMMYVMILSFGFCGIGFMIGGCLCGRDADMKDLSKAETAKAVGKAGAKGALKGAQYAAENQDLLNDA
jgi:hypothetical protein